MRSFAQEIYNWYEFNKRDLPWRNSDNPYNIWISEIILQQTRVAQGINYYLRFIEKFPTVFDLAKSNEDNILKLWQGLGYYSRARNMHHTAKLLVERHNGIFPSDYKTLLSLKGVGKYTAAAIASIAFDLPVAAVDGNIYRIISRYFGISTPIDTISGKSEIQKIADELMPSNNAGYHNQALMEFGALQCVPKSPDCNSCPLIENCFALNYKLVGQLPVKSKKTKQRSRFFYYFIIDNNNSVLLEKRTKNDIWKNLHQFPVLETEKELSDLEIINLEIPVTEIKKANFKMVSNTVKHVLSHQTLYARFIHIETDELNLNDSNLIQVNKKDIYKFAVPKLLDNYINKINLQGK